MKIIGSTNNKIGSYLIRKITKSEISHIAFVFDKVVIHSSLFGVELVWYKTFEKHNKILREVEFKLGLDREEAIWQGILDWHDDTQYDYGAVIYQGLWRLISGVIAWAHVPTRNLWQSDSKHMCIEAYELVRRFVPILPNLGPLAMFTPQEFMDKLEETVRK